GRATRVHNRDADAAARAGKGKPGGRAAGIPDPPAGRAEAIGQSLRQRYGRGDYVGADEAHSEDRRDAFTDHHSSLPIKMGQAGELTSDAAVPRTECTDELPYPQKETCYAAVLLGGL